MAEYDPKPPTATPGNAYMGVPEANPDEVRVTTVRRKPVKKRLAVWVGILTVAVAVMNFVATQDITDWRSAMMVGAGALTIIAGALAKSIEEV